MRYFGHFVFAVTLAGMVLYGVTMAMEIIASKQAPYGEAPLAKENQ